MIGVIGASGFVFLCELAYKRLKNMYTMHYLDIVNFNGKVALKTEVMKKKEDFTDNDLTVVLKPPLVQQIVPKKVALNEVTVNK